MRDQYNEQLEELNERLSMMGALCERCIDSVAVTLSGVNADGSKNEEGTEQRVLKIYRTDSEIDEMERTIEAQCLRLLLKQQPVAGDLRFISAALKRYGTDWRSVCGYRGYRTVSGWRICICRAGDGS